MSNSYFVVVLVALLVNGESIPEGVTLEVDRAVRNDWKGSGLCRDATEAEIEEYLAEHGHGAGVTDLVEVRDELEANIEDLEGRRLTAQRDVDELEGKAKGLQADVDQLEERKNALTAEVAKLEKAAKAAAK